MAEYIDIDAPIDVAVYQRNRRIKVTLRQILESNDANYERADVRPVVRGKWKYRGQQVIDDLFPTYACSVCRGVIPADWKRKCNYCPNCGADMREES